MTGPNRAEGRDKRLCGGRRRDDSGETCRRPAGWGTNHPGHGPCKLHGGSTPNHAKAAQREAASDAVATYGLPREVEPAQALLEEVHRTAGHVAWLAQVINAGTPGDLSQWSEAGRKPSVFVDLYQGERAHLARVAKSALDAGIAERQVRMAEAQGELLAGVIRRVLDALDLTPEQAARVPQIVPAELRAILGGGQ
jgi:hypothetical protein